MKKEDKGIEGFWDVMKEEEIPIVVVAIPKKTNDKKKR